MPDLAALRRAVELHRASMGQGRYRPKGKPPGAVVVTIGEAEVDPQIDFGEAEIEPEVEIGDAEIEEPKPRRRR